MESWVVLIWEAGNYSCWENRKGLKSKITPAEDLSIYRIVFTDSLFLSMWITSNFNTVVNLATVMVGKYACLFPSSQR